MITTKDNLETKETNLYQDPGERGLSEGKLVSCNYQKTTTTRSRGECTAAAHRSSERENILGTSDSIK